jgi:arylsulfatase A-like enzyme
MNRNFRHLAFLIFLVLFLVSRIQAASNPNVLFIAVDDLNDYISPLDNHRGVRTPHFDRLANRSVNFANAHCAAPACHPSRVAVMTGVHPVRSGIYRNMFGAHGPRWRHESPVLEKAVVLSQHFRDHGYRAVGGGKIFHTLQWTPGDSQNDPDAWDAYRGDPLDPISADWPRPKLVSDEEAGLTKGRPLGGHATSQLFGAAVLENPEETYGDHLVTDWAIEQMKKPGDKPLFLAVGLFRPHIPWEVPQRWFDLYSLDAVELPKHLDGDLNDVHNHGRQGWHKWVTDNGQWAKFMRGYLASISYVDHQLGRLLDALDASPMKDNTIIVLWSDHGFHIGEKENWEKFALWNQTTRVPLFIHAPGLSKDGEATRQPATLTDIYPTLCELAGLPIPKLCNGTSLVPQLKEPSTPKKQLALTSFQFWGEKTPSLAIADFRYRFIRYGNGFEELYDLKNDPHEFTNLIGDLRLAKVKARLAKALPKKVAPMRTIPTDSPFHRGRKRRKASN